MDKETNNKNTEGVNRIENDGTGGGNESEDRGGSANGRRSDADKPPEKGKKRKWIVVMAAAAAVAVCVIVFAVVPMVSVKKPVETPAPTILESEATVAPTPSPRRTAAATPEPQPQILPQMRALYAQNSDLAGWIKIEGTKVDYPVMYTPDDGEFYLYRTFEKEKDPTLEGTLFIDKNCTVDPRGTNLIIHGHNMKNGTMFHTLTEYADEEFYKEHPTFEYTTLYEEEEYEIVSVFLSRIYNKDDDVFKFYKFYDAGTEEEFDEFIDNIKELELYKTGIEPEFGDELITLTTCEYSQDNGRIVVVGRKIDDKEIER